MISYKSDIAPSYRVLYGPEHFFEQPKIRAPQKKGMRKKGFQVLSLILLLVVLYQAFCWTKMGNLDSGIYGCIPKSVSGLIDK